jgi:hypothetical protein
MSTMIHRRGTVRIAALTLGFLALAACTPKKYMLGETFVPGAEKVARSSIKPVGSVGSGKEKTILSNYYIQICDVKGGEASACKTNVILENITDYQVYNVGF